MGERAVQHTTKRGPAQLGDGQGARWARGIEQGDQEIRRKKGEESGFPTKILPQSS
jgi:hypothetical protein